MEESKRRYRLQECHVKGVFGLYNYFIPLKVEEGITLLCGPNGVGKSTVLRILYAFFKLDYKLLSLIPVQSCRFGFTNGEEVRIVFGEEESVGDDDPPGARTITFTLVRSGAAQPEETFTVSRQDFDMELWDKLSYHLLRQLARGQVDIPAGRRDDYWRTMVRREFRESGKSSIWNWLADQDSKPNHSKVPGWLADIIEDTGVVLVDTKRLTDPVQGVFPDIIPADDSKLTVDAYSREIIRIIARERRRMSDKAIVLDRTFPRRLVGQQVQSCPSAADLDALMRRLADFRGRLAAAGIIAAHDKEDLDLPGELNGETRAALSLYLNDQQEKLAVLTPLLARVELLLELINNRLLDKRLSIDADKGFRITNRAGYVIHPGKLSAGEQHEITIFFLLLFGLKNNMLVMVDEPELSLHIAWQADFVSDVQEIAKLIGFQMILATHSPAIVGNRWDLAVELGLEEP